MTARLLCRISKFAAAMLLLFSSAQLATAEEVTIEQAQQIAQKVIYGNTITTSSVQPLRHAWSSNALPASRRLSVSSPTFYVFENENGKGFVIVAADDCARPIIGYSYTEPAPRPYDMAPSMVSWLGYVDRCIATARSNNDPRHSAWNKPHSEGEEVRINTALWSQGEPYNRQCPLQDGERCLTGCTATASAIIMYYYKWPESIYGTSEAYTTTRGLYVDSRDLNHAYSWDDMLHNYTEGKYTDTNADAVSTLMADLGHIYQADYGIDGTGALPNYDWLRDVFDYNPGMDYASREGHTQEVWNSLMRAELDAGRPVQYNGYNAEYNNGHAFIVDGYKDNGTFHINWGWGGDGNGYFYLDSLIIKEYDFSYNQWIMMGFEPYKENTDFPNWINFISNFNSTDEYIENTSFTLPYFTLYNHTDKFFSGSIRLAHTDSNGKLKDWVSEELSTQISGYGAVTIDDLSFRIKKNIDYQDRLRLFYRSKGEEWLPVLPFQTGNYSWEIILHPQLKSIGDSTSITYDKANSSLTIEHDYRAELKVKFLGGNLNGVTYGDTETIINTSKLIDKTITVEIKLGNEKRIIELNFKEL